MYQATSLEGHDPLRDGGGSSGTIIGSVIQIDGLKNNGFCVFRGNELETEGLRRNGGGVYMEWST